MPSYKCGQIWALKKGNGKYHTRCYNQWGAVGASKAVFASLNMVRKVFFFHKYDNKTLLFYTLHSLFSSRLASVVCYTTVCIQLYFSYFAASQISSLRSQGQVTGLTSDAEL